jgi:hypothetical protein
MLQVWDNSNKMHGDFLWESLHILEPTADHDLFRNFFAIYQEMGKGYCGCVMGLLLK